MNPLLAGCTLPLRAAARADRRHHAPCGAQAHRWASASRATRPLIADAIRARWQACPLPGHRRHAGLREAIAGWLQRRYGLTLDAGTQVLPVNGSREALFALAQTVIDASRRAPPWSAPTRSTRSTKARPCWPAPRWPSPTRPGAQLRVRLGADARPWARTQLLYVCSPGNPTGAVMPLDEWQRLFELSDRHGFVIASTSAIRRSTSATRRRWAGWKPPRRLGRSDFRNLIAFTSLSKRSNVPGMRSGFVAGDAALLKKFLLYRTYHGSAMSPGAGRQHRRLERRGPCAGQPRLPRQVRRGHAAAGRGAGRGLPDAGFYLWAGVPGGDDVAFARACSLNTM
jgi:N-succinyldiaminopimelate aminotransferase